MGWLRVDDGFAQHPKVVALNARDRWTWLEVLCYCARYRTQGHVPAAISEVVRGANPQFLNRCFELHLLDVSTGGDEGYEVHDWAEYNPKDPTAAERVRRYRSRNTDRNDDRNTGVTVPLARERAGARGPVPSPSPVTTEAAATTHDNDPDAAALEPLLDKLKIPAALRRAAHQDAPRALAVARYTIAQNGNGGFFRTVFDSGDWPATTNGTTSNVACPHCGLGFPSQRRVDEHLENVHGIYPDATLDDEPALDDEPSLT